MLDEATRTAILELHSKGHGKRTIARILGIARDSVREVIRSGTDKVPRLERAEAADAYREQILELHARFGGHLGVVHAELVKQGATFSYQALTAYCRRHGIGHSAPPPAGHYDFQPGQEMQSDN